MGATAEQLWEADVAAGKAADTLSGRPATAAYHGRMAACAAATRFITREWGTALAAKEAALARQKAAGRGLRGRGYP
jgi:hypothetical protein